jgi:phage FluMu protein gp41
VTHHKEGLGVREPRTVTAQPNLYGTPLQRRQVPRVGRVPVPENILKIKNKKLNKKKAQRAPPSAARWPDAGT